MLEYYERVVVQRKDWVGEFIAVFRRIPERFVCAPPLGRRDVAFTLIDGVPVSDFSERNHVNRSGDEVQLRVVHRNPPTPNARQRTAAVRPLPHIQSSAQRWRFLRRPEVSFTKRSRSGPGNINSALGKSLVSNAVLTLMQCSRSSLCSIVLCFSYSHHNSPNSMSFRR